MKGRKPQFYLVITSRPFAKFSYGESIVNRFESLQQAENFATELARKYQSSSFYVLKEISEFKVVPPTVEKS